MTKRLNSKYSVCKKIKNNYKNLWGLKKNDLFRSLFPKKKYKLTPYSKLLNIKQALKFFYSCIKEFTFKKYILVSANSQAKTIDKLASLLESRIDTLLFRSCFVNSFHEARQLINHKFVFVNNFNAITPGIILKKGDIINLKFSKSKLTACSIKILQERLLCISLPNHFEVDWYNFCIFFLWDVNFKTVYFPIDLFYQNICRYYK